MPPTTFDPDFPLNMSEAMAQFADLYEGKPIAAMTDAEFNAYHHAGIKARLAAHDPDCRGCDYCGK